MNKLLHRIAAAVAAAVLATGAGIAGAHAVPGGESGNEARITADTSWSQ